MKLRVLRLITSAYGGGAQRGLLLYLKYHNHKLIHPFVVSLRSGNFDKKFEENLKNDYSCLEQKRRFSIRCFLRLVQFIKEKRIDVIHTHLLEADVYGFLLKLLFPKLKLFAGRHGPNQFRKKIHWGVINFIISIPAKKVICVSKSLTKFINKHEFIPKKKLIYVYNGVDVEKFRKAKDLKFKNQIIDSADKSLLIGIIGRLKKLKGHDVLFKAIKLLKSRNISNIKVLVIGDGKHEQNLKDLRDRLNLGNQIDFLGYQDDINKFYNILDVICLPSKYEGLSNVIIEAMAKEIPILCSDIPSNKEIIRNKKTGLLFKTGDVEDLAEKIEYFTEKKIPINLLTKKAKILVEEKFNIEKNVKILEIIYLNH